MERELFLKLTRWYHNTSYVFWGSGAASFYAGQCKYFPSCSQYSGQAVKKYGFVKGLLLSLWRVLRCNPLSQGGVDIP